MDSIRPLKINFIRMKHSKILLYLLFPVLFIVACAQQSKNNIHVYETKEIELASRNQYDNPYKEVECWVESRRAHSPVLAAGDASIK